MADPLRILVLCGSIRRPSYTMALARSAERALVQRGSRVVVWDFIGKPPPIADPEHHADPHSNPDAFVRELADIADNSDGFIWASPVYHNSYAGVLKNALDNLTIPQFAYKPVGLMGHGTDRTTQAVDPLRIVVRGLHGVSLTANVCTCAEDFQEAKGGQDYEVDSRVILERIDRFVDELLEFAEEFRQLREKRRAGEEGAHGR